MGRPRDKGTEEWATVTETAEALGVTSQAIYNRIDAGTIPFERHLDSESGRPSYRINRKWVEKEAEKKGDEPANRTDLSARQAESLAFFAEWGERLLETISKQRDDIESVRAEVERQRTQIIPLLRELIEDGRSRDERYAENVETILENQTRNTGKLTGIENALNQIHREIRDVGARNEEENRREKQFQAENLGLAREVRDLQQKNLDLSEKLYDLLSRVERAEVVRDQERRQRERRGFLRRLFGS